MQAKEALVHSSMFVSTARARGINALAEPEAAPYRGALDAVEVVRTAELSEHPARASSGKSKTPQRSELILVIYDGSDREENRQACAPGMSQRASNSQG